MTLPGDYIFREGNSSVDLLELREKYRDVARAVNGFQLDYRPVITGQTTVGSKAYSNATYPQRSGLLQITRLIADVWFDVSWTNHNGTGPIQIQLPATAQGIQNFPWINSCLVSNLALPANCNGAFVQVKPGTSVGTVVLSVGGADPISLSLTTSGRLQGHLRFACQINQRP